MVDRGRVLVGGAPLRALRLSDAGAGVARALFRGEPVGDGPGRAALARRLVALGMAHPVPPAGAAGDAGLAVVIPVRDDAAGLARTLDALLAGGGRGGGGGGSGRDLEIVVVDDGSSDPAAVAALAAGRARLVRRDEAGGPAAARNQGLAALAAPVVAFVDAGVTIGAPSLRRLADHLADPLVVAAAPRVASTPGPGLLERYEEVASPLDLGRRPAPARPGSTVPYVPTACLVARVAALRAVGGFDPALRYGEDVDLVWRLAGAGHDVRYDPTVVAHHPPRPTLAALLRQRAAYGSAAGPLARRHGWTVSPSRCSAWGLAASGLALAGHPVAAAGAVAWTARSLRPKLGALPAPWAEAVRLAATGHWWAGRNLGRQLLRTWWPITALAASRRGGRRLLLVGVAASVAARWSSSRGRRASVAVLGVLDDVAYGAGVWRGVRDRSTLPAVLPQLAAGPDPQGDPPGAVTGR